jgi:alpha-D-ribose 1-methylphosphonate 5-triphosphate synthase subunit PhnG
MAEARVQLDDQEGYGACLGRDLQQAIAIAILDAALQAGQQTETINAFLDRQAKQHAEADNTLLRKVESTRVEMETF